MNSQDQGGHLPEEEEEELIEERDEGEAEEDQDDEEEENIVTFNMDHLTEEEKAEEERQIEADISVVIPTADSYTPENRDVPIPGMEPLKSPKLKEDDLPLREPRRSGRPRTILQPHWIKKNSCDL